MTASKSIRDPASGARLADALAAKQMTRSKLAREAGVSMKSIRRWLAGEPISRGNAYAVAKVLEVEAWAIWPDLGPTGALTGPTPVDDDPEPALSVADHGITDVFVSRAEVIRAYPPAEILADAAHVRVMGLSLNQIVQSVSDRQPSRDCNPGLRRVPVFHRLDPDPAAAYGVTTGKSVRARSSTPSSRRRTLRFPVACRSSGFPPRSHRSSSGFVSVTVRSAAPPVGLRS